MTLANADGSEEGPMLTAKGLSISRDLPALLGGAGRVTGVELPAPRLVLERARDGQVIVNARKGLSARANLTLVGLALQPRLADYDRLTGKGDLRFNLFGAGRLAFRQGEVRGLDLAGMIRTMTQTIWARGRRPCSTA